MKAVKNFAFVLVGLIAAAALTLIIINMVRQDEQTETVNSFIDRQDERYAESQKQEDEFIEDGAVIGDIYTIRSTTAISDAYKKGDPSGLSEEDKKTYDLAVKAFEEATKGCTSNYEKELGIFEWIAKNIGHNSGSSTLAILADESYPLDTPYGVLSGKMAVCVGYATTFRLLVNMAGMDCHIPHSESHSWDLVQLDDNEWYYVDIYSATNEGKNPNYSYFNMNETIANDQEDLSMSSSLPKANGKQYLYPVINAMDGDDFYSIPKVVKESIKTVLKGDTAMISIRLKKPPTEYELNMSDALTQAILERLENSEPDLANWLVNANWYKDEDDKPVIAFFFTDNSNSSSVNLTRPEAKKMKDVLDKLFGEGTTDPFVNGGDPNVETSEDEYAA